MSHDASRHIAPARIKNGKSKEMSVIIPCAGAGLRMKSYGPKCLISVKNKLLIDRQLEIITEAFPNSEIIIPVGFEGYKIRKHLENTSVRLIYNPLYDSTNVIFSIGLGLWATNSLMTLVVYGDLIFDKSVIHSLIGQKKSCVISSNTINKEEVGLINSEKKLMRMAYGLQEKWGQIALFTDKELKLLRNICSQEESMTIFGYEAINRILDKGGCFNILKPKGSVFDLDNPKDLDTINKMFLTL